MVYNVMIGWPGWVPDGHVQVSQFEEHKWWIGYDRHQGHFLGRNNRDTYTGLSLNWWSDVRVLFILTIMLETPLRHQGLGTDLYAATAEIGTQLGCKWVQQTPSGWTDRGDTRMNYMLRRGWERYNEIEAILRLD